MPDTDETRALMARTDVFLDVPEAVLEAVLGIARTESLRRGEEVFREGSAGEDMFLVLTGAIELTTEVGRTSTQRLALLDRGQIFGELACFDALPRSATATAFVDADLLRIPGSELRGLIAQNPGLAASLLRNLVKKLSLRLRDADQEIRSLSAAAARH
ncbi:MAG: cyclic nucleotide-binding domain-containing protein [Candidatus Sericytochromatia bacterium]|nr:cyclic nucleotide-binding domain-containing protein [Candidatus Sericytochromatia bacterium]